MRKGDDRVREQMPVPERLNFPSQQRLAGARKVQLAALYAHVGADVAQR